MYFPKSHYIKSNKDTLESNTIHIGFLVNKWIYPVHNSIDALLDIYNLLYLS